MEMKTLYIDDINLGMSSLRKVFLATVFQKSGRSYHGVLHLGEGVMWELARVFGIENW